MAVLFNFAYLHQRKNCISLTATEILQQDIQTVDLQPQNKFKPIKDIAGNDKTLNMQSLSETKRS